MSSGTITVNEDSSVQVLAEEAVPVDWIDPQNAKDILTKAQNDLSSANTEEAKAEAQIAVEGKIFYSSFLIFKILNFLFINDDFHLSISDHLVGEALVGSASGSN